MNNAYNKGAKRYTITEWVDIDTGLMITKGEKSKNYKIINTTFKYEYKERNEHGKVIGYVIKTITRECRHRGQLELELE